MPHPLKIPLGVCFALGVAAVLACNNGHDEEDDNQFRDDVLWCEEAVARLERCCPGFDARRVECQFYYSFDEGCGSQTTRRILPAFAKEESSCIRKRTCDELVNQGICERAAARGLARTSTVTTSSTSSGSTSTGSTSSGSTSSGSTSSGSTSSGSTSSGSTSSGSTSSGSTSTTSSGGRSFAPVCP